MKALLAGVGILTGELLLLFGPGSTADTIGLVAGLAGLLLLAELAVPASQFIVPLLWLAVGVLLLWRGGELAANLPPAQAK